MAEVDSVETVAAQDDAAQNQEPQVPVQEPEPEYDTVSAAEVLGLDQDDSPAEDAAQEQETKPDKPADYYRSQEEVDAAIDNRLASARTKWEKEHENLLSIGQALAPVFQGMSAEERTKALEDLAVAQYAQRNQIDEPLARRMMDLEAKIAQRPADPTAEDAAGDREAAEPSDFTMNMMRGAALIQVKHRDRDFDPVKAFEEHEDFKKLCLVGVDPVEAYEMTILRDRENARQTEAAEARKAARPATLGTGKGQTPELDFRKMSDAEFRKFDQRLKAGEHIKI